jgi:hypothetical protein
MRSFSGKDFLYLKYFYILATFFWFFFWGMAMGDEWRGF